MDVRKIEPDEDHDDIVKINPLADWNYDEVRDYIRRHNVPYNRLHGQGYPSIGCAPCTRAVKPWRIFAPVTGGGQIRMPERVRAVRERGNKGLKTPWVIIRFSSK